MLYFGEQILGIGQLIHIDLCAIEYSLGDALTALKRVSIFSI